MSDNLPQKEVERIWGLTEFMSAQTPLEVRMMIVKMVDAGITFTPRELFEMSVLLDLRAVMTKDESKFAHLVAGTETIVKTLQNVNPLMRHLERQEALIDQQSDQITRLEAKLDTLMHAIAEGGKLEIKTQVLHGGDEEATFLAQAGAEALAPKTATPTTEEYDGNVGSAWDQKNPSKGPIQLPTASEEFQSQKAKYEKMIERHRQDQFRQRILKHS
jgi:hypothetical protein